MEHNPNKIVRSKISEAENNHVDFDREKILSGLNFASKTKKAWKAPLYYSAAASVLICFFLYRLSNNNAVYYQARVQQVKTLKNKTREIDSEPEKIESTQIEKNKSGIEKIETIRKIRSKSADLIATQAIEKPSFIAIKNTTIEPKLIAATTELKKKKIKAIIGVDYTDNKGQKNQKGFPFQIEIGLNNNENTLVYAEKSSILKTTIN